MLDLKTISHLIVLSVTLAIPQINLHYTDEISEVHQQLQHHCLSMVVDPSKWGKYREIITFCMSELPSKFNMEDDDSISKLTFDQLSTQNISSEQLYFWHAPIDTMEDYQLHLNQLSTSPTSSFGRRRFYNCTLPRFGPKCQYQLHTHDSSHTSLDDIINQFYINFPSNATSVTCYQHLQCNRGPAPMCLDWSEICDGVIDCFDGGRDEKDCWELEINECKDNEHRCRNGQCIPLSFFHDKFLVCDCIDGSDELNCLLSMSLQCQRGERPFILCEGFRCQRDRVTSSCNEKRAGILIEALVSMIDHRVTTNCSSAFTCLMNFLDPEYLACNGFCEVDACMRIVRESCPDLIYFPNFPILFGDIFFALTKNDPQKWTAIRDVLFYLCYNNSHYDGYFLRTPKISVDNMTCIQAEELHPLVGMNSIKKLYAFILDGFQQELTSYSLSLNYDSEMCHRPNMYRCDHSPKCISKFRLLDGVADCPLKDDEDMGKVSHTSFIEHIKKSFHRCETSNRYIPHSKFHDYICDCGYYAEYWCEDLDLQWVYKHKNLLFQHVCDGFLDLFPRDISGRNQTDETDCEQWECDNIYTHLDGIWNCPNGADETGRFPNSILNCSSNHHLCVSIDTNEFMCLPVERANDGVIDCLGATDERRLCGKSEIEPNPTDYYFFYCRNQSTEQCISNWGICDGRDDCKNGDDEKFCNDSATAHYCSSNADEYPNEIVHIWCSHFEMIEREVQVHFKLPGMISNVEDEVSPEFSIIEQLRQEQSNCHLGLPVQVWLDYKKNLTDETCLCPTNYYGHQCQYQNQKVSLIVKFRTLSDSWRTLFAIVISLIDDSDQRIIHSYQQLNYLSIRDCETKFSIHLLYSTRPKNATRNYTIHIDIYEKDSFAYRGSLLLPIPFSFLPLHHLAYLIDIPRKDDQIQICTDRQCIHGKCRHYSNDPENATFCQCDRGWTGKSCDIAHSCTCADGALCIGVSAHNRSICICSKDRFGPRCLLTNRICESKEHSTCRNGGQCIPDQNFSCLCPKNFTGAQCEIGETQLVLSFDTNIPLPEEMFIHFIEVNSKVIERESVVRSTTFRTIPLHQDSVIVYWAKPFHLVFIELFIGTYYLAYIQPIYNQSITIYKRISPSDRCPHIRELLKGKLADSNLVSRIKSYHLPCQDQTLNLSCFHDEVHLCLCYSFGSKRLANCLKFDHNLRFNCLDSKECVNNGTCIQDHPKCPTKSICMCPACFFGQRCQFSSNGFGLSLDAILGYHIQADVQVHRQPAIVQFSLGLTIIFILLGLTSGFLSLITFKNKTVLDVGCGIYLLGSSITTLLLTMTFGWKFFFLLLVQMNRISNRRLIAGQCYVIDYLFGILLNMGQWLNACVAVERAVTTIKGTAFVKKKSRAAAIRIAPVIFLVIALCSIHDPLYRRIIDENNNDDDESSIKRIWCTVTYGSSLQLYSHIIYGFHFIVPFVVNLISVIILLRTKIHQQLVLHRNRTYTETLRKQLKELRHLIVAPIALVLLGVPRLILTYLLKCMTSNNDAWLFLILYFISLFPALVTFIVFILPSKYYRKQLQKTVKEYRTILRRGLHLEP